MKYSIVTPTYNRPDKLIRCVESILNQNKNSNNIRENFDFELIIVNDSPLFDYSIFNSYLAKLKIENFESFSKIKYFVNKENMGVNFSRNYALDYISKDITSDYTIFLDDDDWLHDDALKNIDNILKEGKDTNWLVTNMSVDDLILTKNKTNKNIINYFWDYLIFKKFTGDSTHVINSKLATRFRFSTKIKNGEEWLYFIKIKYDFLYVNINTKLSNGYDASGITKIEKNKYIKNTKILWQDLNNFKNIKIFIYLFIRFIYIFIK